MGSAHRRTVLAVLAMSANQSVSRQQLIDAVWGESPPSSAEGSIYTYVSDIRRALEPERSRRNAGQILTTVSSGYCLRLPPDACDVHRFQEYRSRAQQCWARQDATGAIEALDSALRLWKGEALSGIPGPFASVQRPRLTELRLATLEQRAEIVIAEGGHAEIVAELSALVREHPMREALRALLMLALYRSDRKGEALAVFRETRQTLIEELGIEPASPLRNLHEQMLANDPSLARVPVRRSESTAPKAAPVDPTPSQPAPVKPAPPKLLGVESRQPSRPARFVGRSAEVSFLRDAVSDVAAGNGRAVWIEGEPGIGKSCLLAEGLAEAIASGCQVAWGVSDELGQRFTLRVLLECLGVKPDSADPRRAELASALRDRPDTSASDEDVQPVVHNLLNLVAELCADAPLVLVIDDLHWADAATLLVWQHLCRLRRELPLLLIGACRPVPVRAELDQVRANVEADATVLPLGPLPESAVHEFVSAIVGLPVSAKLRAVVKGARGNPRYVEETVNGLLREGAIVFAGGYADTDPSLDDAVPDAALSAIAGHLRFLSGQTTELLRRAALLGEQFSLAEAAIALDRPASDLIEMVDEACAAGLLMESHDLLAFRHPLVHKVFYAKMPNAVRLAMHRQLAEALAKAGAPADRVAAQLTAAPVTVDSWLIDWLLANVGVLSSNAPHSAAALLRAALNRGSISSAVREKFAAAFARLMFWLGREPASSAQFVVARTTDSLLDADMRLILAYIYYRRGGVGKALDEIRPAMRDELVPETWRSRYTPLLAALESAEFGDPGNRQAVTAQRRDSRSTPETSDRAPDAFETVPQLADLWMLALDDTMLALQDLDHVDDALGALRAAEHYATSHTLPGEISVAGVVHYYWLGLWPDALGKVSAMTLADSLTESYLLGRPGASAILHGVAALIAGHRNEQATARAHLHSAGQWSRRNPTGFLAGSDFLLMARSLLAEGQGRLEAALERRVPILTSDFAPMTHRYRWLPGVARIAAQLGDSEAMRLALEVCESEMRRDRTAAREAAAAHCRGLVNRDLGAVLTAADHYRSAGRRIELAGAEEDAAILFAERSRLDDARAALGASLSTYAELGAVWNVQQAESRLEQFGLQRLPGATARASGEAEPPGAVQDLRP
ncbi:BTAD domain-containing putative transcriptional regulator [Saccharopolyspora phatthalungensis]|uniref:BTAD domain-containing putative transcriptional regulator n=1 Tax=Saccharopolyspora phatthalungensis TaxID=664693 RepID=UPI001FED0DE2|nr:BTAD domain-containing putative transcriptional regulator [Saccharopolyspora phatthalungensis]